METPFVHLFCFFLLLHPIWARPSIRKRDADFESVRTRLDRSYVKHEPSHPSKYFHESTFHVHYDGRFGAHPLPYDEQPAHLSAMIRCYLSAMNEIGVETWLMHGTLLGWYWNRKIMPWDSDVDVMVSERSIRLLAAYYNMTIHNFHIPGSTRPYQYLLEINPHYAEDKLDEQNKIDARWIDTDSGLFIDITTLRRDKAAAANGETDAMMVKDKHQYNYDDIYPLVDSVFEGSPACIPYAYPAILVEEYGHQALSDIHHASHRFAVEQQAWVLQKSTTVISGLEGSKND